MNQLKAPGRKFFARHRLALLILLVFTGAAGCLRGPGGKSSWSGATGTEQHERLMWQAIHDKKWNEVENHTAATFTGVDTRGQSYDRAGWIEHWKKMDVRDFSLGELNIQPNGPDMVVSYVAHLSGEDSGQPISQTGLQVVSVWQQLKHGWVMIAQTTTTSGS